jgi:hypothetical protein
VAALARSEQVGHDEFEMSFTSLVVRRSSLARNPTARFLDLRFVREANESAALGMTVIILVGFFKWIRNDSCFLGWRLDNAEYIVKRYILRRAEEIGEMNGCHRRT